ncbi:hypothetical protein JCM19037_1618 [Geomicrobium sp. JCM 19037]|uniref:hypothetical protein n=1 Tax=Geomicrobium sp. JCM 19037 TaxID=1460634 RepID=UPI00045F3147|nr:hypothetical protein [Geomicrobium sp. JCM 19037]GAK03304.1 hypothetical protein JCM19037_1618 [Geomicrobium sp. JCM 19037]
MNIAVKGVTNHAVDRAVERIGISRQAAANHLKQLMTTARYIGAGNESKNRHIFYHDKSNVSMVVGKNGYVITCHKGEMPMRFVDMQKPYDIVALPSELLSAVKRKANALLRAYTKDLRAIERQVAEIELKIAQCNVKKLRVHNPETKALIDGKIAYFRSVAGELTDKQAELQQKKDEVSAHV